MILPREHKPGREWRSLSASPSKTELPQLAWSPVHPPSSSKPWASPPGTERRRRTVRFPHLIFLYSIALKCTRVRDSNVVLQSSTTETLPSMMLSRLPAPCNPAAWPRTYLYVPSLSPSPLLPTTPYFPQHTSIERTRTFTLATFSSTPQRTLLCLYLPLHLPSLSPLFIF